MNTEIVKQDPQDRRVTIHEDSSVLDGIERAQIDMQIATAKRWPRTLSKVKQDMLSFATLDEETASSCFWTLPRGGKVLQGPSVRLAEIAVSCYSNLRAGSRVVSVQPNGDNPYVVIQSVAHDLEKNVAITIEKRRAITPKKDKRTGQKLQVTNDDINLAANACSAIAFRDAIFKVVPLALIKPVFEQAKRVAVGQVHSMADRRAKVIDRLKQMGAAMPNILAAVNARKIEDIGMSELETLIGLGTSIKDGEISIEDAFPQNTNHDFTTGQAVLPEPRLQAGGNSAASAESEVKQEQAEGDGVPMDSAPTPPPQPRRGRPPGSRNKQRSEPAIDPMAAQLRDTMNAADVSFEQLRQWGCEFPEIWPDAATCPSYEWIGNKTAQKLVSVSKTAIDAIKQINEVAQ